MRVADLLRTKERDLITVAPSATIPEAMELLISNKVSCLPVLGEEDGLLVGIISDKDIFRRVHQDYRSFRDTCVKDLMTTELIVGLLEDEISYIAGIMTTNRIRHVPIVDGERLVGLVSVGDIVKTQMEDARIENRYLWQYINGTYPA
jgi:CBS domain-containing protein